MKQRVVALLRPVRGHCLLRCLILAIFLTPQTVCLSGTGEVTSLPTGRTKIKNGLRLKIDTRWVDANGYRPVRVEVTTWPPLPAAADRTIRVVLSPGNWYGMTHDVSVSQIIEIPQGNTRVTQVISMPQSGPWNTLKCEVFEDGKPLEDLTESWSATNYGGRNTWSEASPSMLIIDDVAPPLAQRGRFRNNRPATRLLPDIRRLTSMFPNHDSNNHVLNYDWSKNFDDDDTLNLLKSLPKVEMLPLVDLPSRWIDFTCFDLAIISMADLTTLRSDYPDRWQALRSWLASGQTLCVYDVGPSFARLEELEQKLDISPLATATEDELPWRGWTEPKPDKYRGEIHALADYQDRATQYAYAQQEIALSGQEGGVDKERATARSLPRPDNPHFVFRDVAMGSVVALSSKNPFPGSREEWSWLFNSLPSEKWMWYRRHGFSLSRNNSDYWNFLIPGVGTAPVVTFLVLISLFVVLVGPVNYVVLRRARRLYLLLVTVPGSAALISLGLFSYAMLNDGLGVRVRSRSVTYLDQTRESVVSWSRQSYFAGMAPSQGLTFPQNAAVYPIDESANDPYNRRRSKRRLVWDEGQSLQRGFFESRNTSQFMVILADTSAAELRLRRAKSDPGSLSVENRLGADVEKLLVCDFKGDHYWTENLAEGKSTQMSPISRKDAAGHFGRAWSDHRPGFPKGFDPNRYNAFMGRRNYYYGRNNNYDSQLSDPKVTTSLLEVNLRRNCFLDSTMLVKRTYLAIVATPVGVPLGAEAPRQEAGFHIIHGKW